MGVLREVLNPAFRILDYCADITFSPRRFAKYRIKLGDKKNFRQGLALLLTYMPLGIVFQRVALAILGLDTFHEYVNWIHTALGLLLFASTVVFALSMFHRAR